MIAQTLLIISDRFQEFATQKNVMTISELNHLLNAEEVLFSPQKKIRLVPGQGFGQTDIDLFLSAAIKSKNAQHFDFNLFYNIPMRADKSLTHKHNAENTLIATPRQLAKGVFEADILIDEKCELMADHQTGLHVQGMLLLEAARQTYIAIIEKFFPDENKRYFIFNNLNVDYNNFAFPLPATLKAEIRVQDFSNPKKQRSIMDMNINQCDTQSASFSLDMTMMHNRHVAVIEKKMATKTLNQYLENLPEEALLEEVAN